MTSGETGNARSAALDEYIARWAEQGFRVESKSSLQAVLVRRHRGYFLLSRFGRGEQRLVVSVDQHGEVAALAAQPVRW